MGTRVYVGRLSYDVRERDLEKFFKGYGRIREILMKNGFGFVEFDDYRDADDAVYELNGKELLGERVIVQVARGPAQRNRPFGYRRRTNWIEKVSVEHARGPLRGSDLWGYRNRNWRTPPRRRAGKEKYGPPTRTEYRLIVENLSSRVSWQDLKDFMRQAGEVTYADAHKQRRNEGVVEFASYGDMKTAIEKLDNTELNGRRIRLVEDRPRHRSRSHSRSRSKSRSHSQSRSRSRSRSHSKSRSKSRSRSQSASRSRSKSRSKSPSKSHSRSRSKTPENQSKSGSKSRSPSREKSKSKSKSPSNSPANSPAKSPSKSPSKSPVPEEKSAEEEMDDKD